MEREQTTIRLPAEPKEQLLQEADERIQKSDQTKCVNCRCIISKTWNYCPKCGHEIIKTLLCAE